MHDHLERRVEIRYLRFATFPKAFAFQALKLEDRGKPKVLWANVFTRVDTSHNMIEHEPS